MKSKKPTYKWTILFNLKVAILLMSVILFGYIATTFIFPHYSPDMGFYLKIALDLADGFSFYNDMNVAYTPLGMYIFSALFYFFPDAGFYTINSFYLLFYIANGYIFFKILDYFKIDFEIKLILLLVQFISLYILEGIYILLEPFVLLFQLFAILQLLKYKNNKKWYLLFIAGISSFFAFYSKQYGLFIIPAFVYFIFVNSKFKAHFFRNFILFGIGFLIPLIANYIYFCAYKNIPFFEFTYKIAGLSYLAGEESVTGLNYPFVRFLESTMNFILKTSFIIVIFYSIFSKLIKFVSVNTTFFVLIILGSYLQIYFAGYYHYYQLIFPFCLLLIAQLIQQQSSIARAKIVHLFTILSFVFILLSAGWFLSDFFYLKKLSEEQKINQPLLNKILPSGSKVYLQGISPAYYFLCKYNSPDLLKLGYRFPDELGLCRIDKNLPSDSYLIGNSEILKQDIFQKYTLIKEVNLHNSKKCIVLKKNN